MYRVATNAEKRTRGFNAEDSLLLGPSGFECILTRPGANSWDHQAKRAVEELNLLYRCAAGLTTGRTARTLSRPDKERLTAVFGPDSVKKPESVPRTPVELEGK